MSFVKQTQASLWTPLHTCMRPAPQKPPRWSPNGVRHEHKSSGSKDGATRACRHIRRMAAIVIDLDTPPPSPRDGASAHVAYRVEDDGAINLDSDDDCAPGPLSPRHASSSNSLATSAAPSSTALGKRKEGPAATAAGADPISHGNAMGKRRLEPPGAGPSPAAFAVPFGNDGDDLVSMEVEASEASQRRFGGGAGAGSGSGAGAGSGSGAGAGSSSGAGAGSSIGAGSSSMGVAAAATAEDDDEDILISDLRRPSGQPPPANEDKKGEGEEECMEVEAPTKAMPSAASPVLGEDEDIVFAGRSGDLALSDFPHARENCLDHPFRPGNEHNRCANCYCYCCDVSAAKCPSWNEHCKATHTSARWVQMRKALKAGTVAAHGRSGGAVGASSSSSAAGAAAAGAAAAGAAAAAAAAAPVTSRVLSTSERQRWSCERILKEIEQVYPVETPEPAGFAPGISLRPYQRQSLAFMLQIERSDDRRHLGRPHSGQKTGKSSPYSYETASGYYSVRGGFLCDEMGMGKTAVCAALALANPLQPDSGDRRRRATVVLVNNTLVGQWHDEVRKFAPGAVVIANYGNSKRDLTQALVDSCDIFITKPHSGPRRNSTVPTTSILCRRLILDESHLYNAKSQPKLPPNKVFGFYKPLYSWCVTGTPFSNSLEQLEIQARMIGQWEGGVELCRVLHPPPKHEPPKAKEGPNMSNRDLCERLKLVMIRHSKSQRLHGEVALSLPESEVATSWLDFTPDERILYNIHACADGVPKWADGNRHTACSIADVSSGISRRRSAAAHLYLERAVVGTEPERVYTLDKPARGAERPQACAAFRRLMSSNSLTRTKYNALLADLRALRDAASGPLSVVIFTHHNEVLSEVSSLLRAQPGGAYTVYEVSRQTEPGRRHRALRNFQLSGDGGGGGAPTSSSAAGAVAPPAPVSVFATTFATAAVGLTLTAASRVYLLEASIDPAQEAQAAGRIHRLGQTKEVLVKRFYFRASIDEAIAALHGQIASGGLKLGSGGTFPAEALALFQRHGVAQPHTRDESAPHVETRRRYTSADKANVERHGGRGGFDYGKKVMTQVCRCCDQPVEVPGTSVWWGKGKWAPLLNGCTDDNPACLEHASADSYYRACFGRSRERREASGQSSATTP